MSQSIDGIFKSVPDYRKGCAFKLHILTDILLLSLCVVVSGAEMDEEIATMEIRKRIKF